MPDDQKNDQSANEGADESANAGEGQNQGDDQNNNSDAANDGKNDAGEGEGTDEGENGDENGADDDQKGHDKNAKAPAKKGQEGEGNDDDQEPQTRKRLSKSDFIIRRQRQKIAKEQSKNNKGDDADDEGSDDDDEIAPEDEELITKVVSKKFAPIIEKSLAADDEVEIQDFLKENPDFKEFEAKARKFMQHPSRRSLPIKTIFYEVAGDKLLKIGAERARKADKSAKETQTGGGSNRSGEGVKGAWDMPKDDFAKKQEEVRRKQAQ